MLAAGVRSGLVETVHDGAVAVCDPGGRLLAWSGDIDRPFYMRSAAKPFQAHVSQEWGTDLRPVELALAAASHRGHPVHVSLVESMLARVGFSPDKLRCPPAWPSSSAAARRLATCGEREPQRVWHNCSGKHAAFLRACAAQGWPVETYLDPGHSLQKRVIALVLELGEHPVEPVGVDGCGAPTFRTTVRAMARMYSRLASEPALSPVFEAMHRYPALVAANGEGDSSIAMATHSAAKSGAGGCLGVAVHGRLGVAVKSWDGLGEVATVAAIAVLERVGELTGEAPSRLENLARPPVMGGEWQVGVMEPRVELSFT